MIRDCSVEAAQVACGQERQDDKGQNVSRKIKQLIHDGDKMRGYYLFNLVERYFINETP
jgi:hypothetical protein